MSEKVGSWDDGILDTSYYHTRTISCTSNNGRRGIEIRAANSYIEYAVRVSAWDRIVYCGSSKTDYFSELKVFKHIRRELVILEPIKSEIKKKRRIKRG